MKSRGKIVLHIIRFGAINIRIQNWWVMVSYLYVTSL